MVVVDEIVLVIGHGGVVLCFALLCFGSMMFGSLCVKTQERDLN